VYYSSDMQSANEPFGKGEQQVFQASNELIILAYPKITRQVA
jgi:hypothetical protein